MKNLKELKKGESFFFNDNRYVFIELFEELENTAKVIMSNGYKTVACFGGGIVNKKSKPGFDSYLKNGGRLWD